MENSKEKIENMPFAQTEAEIAFEKIAQRIDKLFQKKHLSEKEQDELNLLFNNAMIIQEILEGKTPEEL
ncbi:hypothetical protein A3J56_03260 [Candidatus Giovannonibacteria bacterium RIFCSPHIGHO2_02_FULL_46_20]|uniref:Uncharacterized protein n=1 Tax=Candidatus Giovannonibacteria bacterium RIFCSPHIGHO2_02_FULL_46_20 TaxID=1798338 RepID=A0A1F5WGL8_9BACT|nr:MAG: hypothetical protein A3J56_03260 [Candidatus Giovannonibacteria bacterium RIFCSPHIGHO2_02_FULL_46_20]